MVVDILSIISILAQVLPKHDYFQKLQNLGYLTVITKQGYEL